MMTSFLPFLLVLLGVLSVTSVQLPEPVFVRLKDGSVLRGRTTTSTNSSDARNYSVFKGIRFAQPPIDALRWAPPKPWVNTEKTVDATRSGDICVQGTSGHVQGSEDCLFLNVDVPSDFKESNLNSSLPVAIFIHGGSYRTGCGSMYSGTDMINFWSDTGEKAIVVTVNYRLNVFGFAGSSLLRAQDAAKGSTGVYGLLDQRMAMAWVKENIAAFGGDPNRVTIFGESAGAGSVSSHLTMKGSWPYFNAAIMESGSFAPWITMPTDYAETIFNSLINESGCSDVNCMLGKTTNEIFEASLKVQSPDPVDYSIPFFPSVDGVDLLTHPWIAVSEGNVADVPIMHGTNADEGESFIPLAQNATLNDLLTFWKVSGFNDLQIERLTELYIVNKTYPGVDRDTTFFFYAGERSYGDYSMSCSSVYSSIHLAQQQLNGLRKNPIYLYTFDFLRTHHDFAPHFDEVAFVFHWEYLGFKDADKQMSDVMTSYWGNFFISHEPDSRVTGLATVAMWPQYDLQSYSALALESGSDQHASARFKMDECDFMNDILNRRIRQMFSKY